MPREVPPEEWVSYIPSQPEDLDGPEPTYGTEGLTKEQARQVEREFAAKAHKREKTKG